MGVVSSKGAMRRSLFPDDFDQPRWRDGHESFVRTRGDGVQGALSPELVADLRLYRALVTTTMLGDMEGARREFAQGMAVLVETAPIDRGHARGLAAQFGCPHLPSGAQPRTERKPFLVDTA
jgi:hypothetical protein